MKSLLSLGTVAALAFFVSGCVVNPVTGKSELSMLSVGDEIALGGQHYQPSQQAQGGQYVVDKNLTAYVASVGKKLAAVSDNPNLPYEFVVLNNDVPNAWALPGGKMAINRGLLVYLEDEAQLAAVLGHEIVHAAARHSAQQQTRNTLLTGALTVAGVVAAAQNSDKAALGVGALGIGATAWQAKYGRDHELQSDEVGIKYMAKAGYDAQAAVELQQIFVRLSQANNAGFLEGLFASHPPSQSRVAANQKTAAKYSGGVRNKAQYQKAIAQLVKDKAAYDNYTQAQKLASQQKYIDAEVLVDRAIAQQPQENLFWDYKGQLQVQQGKNKEAVNSFTKAINANPSYFKPYLYRGVVNHQLGNTSTAEQDLLYSQRYLPTQAASYYLGEVNLKKGNKAQAKTYFQAAVSGGGNLGEAAQAQLNKL